MDSSSSHSTRSFVKSDCFLRSKSKKGEEEFCSKGMALEKGARCHFSRKLFISIAQSKVLKEIRSRKQSTIVRALRAGRA
jgi:hypothetical protein